MEYRAPSVKKLMESFKISKVAADSIRKQFHEIGAQAGLRRADTYFPTYGIESIQDRRGKTVLMYLNTGDTYNMTLCVNVQTGHVFCGSWGDWVEKNQSRYGIR